MFSVMFFSSCHLIARDKRAENNPGESITTRSLATAGGPLYQICATEGFVSRHYDGESSSFLEIIGGSTTTGHYKPSRILTSSECVWVKESEFKKIGIRTVLLKPYGSGGGWRRLETKTDHNGEVRSGKMIISIRWLCSHYSGYSRRRCSPRNYIVKASSEGEPFASNTIFQPDLPKSYMYPPPISQ